jgi:hypothetical protein
MQADLFGQPPAAPSQKPKQGPVEAKPEPSESAGPSHDDIAASWLGKLARFEMPKGGPTYKGAIMKATWQGYSNGFPNYEIQIKGQSGRTATIHTALEWFALAD